MMTAFVYILSSITLMLVLTLTRSAGHEKANGIEVFKYQPGLLRVLFWCSPVPLVLMALVYVVTTPTMSNLSLALLLLIGTIGSGAVWYVYQYTNSFRVDVGPSGLKLSKLRGATSIEFKDVKRVDYIDSDKGVFYLDLFDGAEKRVAHLAGTLQDFDELHRLVRAGAIRNGAAYRTRDKWGKWS